MLVALSTVLIIGVAENQRVLGARCKRKAAVHTDGELRTRLADLSILSITVQRKLNRGLVDHGIACIEYGANVGATICDVTGRNP